MKKLLTAKRATRRTWTAKQWKDVVQNVRKMNWGAQPHGGRREGVKSKVKATPLAALPPVARPVRPAPSDRRLGLVGQVNFRILDS